MTWKLWPDRFRQHLKRHGLTQAGLAEGLDDKVTPGTISHWLTGRRDINLTDFFSLCASAGADPAKILFGGDIEALTRAKLSSIIDSIPEENPRYRQFEVGAKLPRRRKAPAKTRK